MNLALVAALVVPMSTHSTPPSQHRAKDDVWHGTYECRQGKTAVTIRLHHESDKLVGTFEFGALAENPNVPHGLFEISGTLSGDHLVVEPGAWIERPQNYVTVGFAGEMNRDHRLFHGTIGDAGCGQIDLVHD